LPRESAASELSRLRRLRITDRPPPDLRRPLDAAPSPTVKAILAAANERAERAYPRAGLAPRAVRLKVYGDLGEVEHEWRTFEAAAVRTAFQSFDSLMEWQKHIGNRTGATPTIVTGREPDGRLVLILPLMVERRGPVRRLTWLGSELCDCNAPLLAPEFARSLTPDVFARLWSDVVRLLRADRRFRFDLVYLAKMPDTINGQPNPFLALAVRANPSSDPEVQLYDYVAPATAIGRPIAIATVLYRRAKRLINGRQPRSTPPPR